MPALNPLSTALSFTLKSLHQPLEIFSRYQQLTSSSTSPKAKVLRNCAYGDHPQQKADVFLPPSASANNQQQFPIAVVVHGGFWVAGDKSTYTDICKRLCHAGVIVVNINYRLAPSTKYTEQIQDLNHAILWINQTLHALKGNPQQLYLLGDNAGANLALTYSLALQHPYLRNALGIQRYPKANTIKGLILLNGLYDMEAGILHHLPMRKLWQQTFFGHAKKNRAQQIELASPLRHLHPQLPPIFIGGTEADPLFSQSVALANALKEQNHTYATGFYDKIDHPHEHHWMFSLQIKGGAKKMLSEVLNFLSWRIEFDKHLSETITQDVPQAEPSF